MEIVVRTPHGDADVSIESHTATTTLGEVVAAVTGQAIPRLVQVDGRVVDAVTQLDLAGLLVGSVVTTEPTLTSVHSPDDVDIVQVAGHGVGRTTRVGPGRYRVGPGRRSNAEELDPAPVEQTAFEVVVEATDTASTVTVVSAEAEFTHAVTLDGTPLDTDQTWQNELLTVGSRAFRLESPARSEPLRPYSSPERDGTVAFSRPPRRPSTRARQPVVDAARDARLHAPALWERRRGQPDAFQLSLGVRVDDATDVIADLESDRAMAIVGSDRFRRALARTVVVEAATLHGPVDLDLVVVTDANGLAGWDWAKWLPHLRLGGPPQIWSSRHDIVRWAEGAAEQPASRPGDTSPLTIVMLDDPGVWNRGDAALRAMVSSPPEGFRLIALCDDEVHAPAICTTVISETDDGLARLQRFTRIGDDVVFRAALTEASVAVDVTRALAPLVDVELPRPAPTIDGEPTELAELIGLTETDEILDRWIAIDPRATATLGRDHHGDVVLAVADDVTIVIGSSMGDAFDVAATSVFAQCVERSPDDLWVAPLAVDGGPRSELLRRLPHATDPHDHDTVIEPRRLLARLRNVLADPGGPARIVLVAEDATDSMTTPDGAWVAELADGVRTIDGLALVVITDRANGTHLLGDTVIRVQRRSDATGAAVRRSASIDDPDGSPGPSFVPVQPAIPRGGRLELSPFVVGRAFTPLERRIEQRRALAASAPDVAFDALMTRLLEAASRHRPRHGDTNRIVVPPPMPTTVDLDELFASSPGDGVPLGLTDDPSLAGARTRWWEPGSGSLLVFGSRRSGMEQVLNTVLLGLIDRFSDLDVRLVVVEGSSARRRALAGIDRNLRIVAPDRSDEVADALDEIVAELERNREAIEPTAEVRPRLVVLVDDLGHVRRRYPDHAIVARIDEVLAAAAAPGSGVDVIASAVDLDAAGPFATVAANRLVGASSDHAGLAMLGVEDPGELGGVPGRCRDIPGGGLVQIAMTDETVETLLGRRTTGDPS